MKHLTILIAFLMTIGSQVSARGITVKYDYDCSHWVGARGGSYMSEPIQNFLVGLLDGLALGTGNDIWGSKGGLQDTQVFFWMDRHCANNPLNSLIPATYELMTERFGRGWNVR